MDRSRVKDTTSIREGRPDKPAKVNLFQTSRFFADVWVLRPGQGQATHRHEREDKLVHVLSGSGHARSGAGEHVLTPGSMLFCPASEDHSLENRGDEDLRVLVFMAPHPKPPVHSVPPAPPAPPAANG